ncbi:E3 ubiquitin-protein ligase TM129-like [Penaeus japonicus]|uniref:E3 ubiquitin-protein ligase TM129-like n=1 Tax=Penaeus japonicus TaxID=27405 RepID=UPI001C7154A4|nr:E3 ubiquitin-protein ligase TM129-like [Penaeus japonicus]
MAAEVWCYSLLYCLFTLIVLYPPDEVVSAGLTVEALLGSWLGSQLSGFIQYHVRRTAATLVVHSLLLPGYFIMLFNTQPWVMDWANSKIHPNAVMFLVVCSVAPVIMVAILVAYWRQNNWKNHPLCRTLALYAQNDVLSPNAWVTVASNVNTEFRRVDKFSTKVNSVCCVVATDSWLMKVMAYRVHLTHQRDAVLSLEGSFDQRFISHNSSMDTQLLTICVNSIKEGISPFYIRLTSIEYTELERKIVNPVVNAREVVIKQSLSDRFLSAFSEAVSENPKVALLEEQDMCIGCMAVKADVKLQRRCGTTTAEGGGGCVTCYCRPMWCLTCLGKWFAARQDQDQPEVWLSSRAPCPTCRSAFCILDVCIISEEN